jgi:hypothetical protein
MYNENKDTSKLIKTKTPKEHKKSQSKKKQYTPISKTSQIPFHNTPVKSEANSPNCESVRNDKLFSILNSDGK